MCQPWFIRFLLIFVQSAKGDHLKRNIENRNCGKLIIFFLKFYLFDCWNSLFFNREKILYHEISFIETAIFYGFNCFANTAKNNRYISASRLFFEICFFSFFFFLAQNTITHLNQIISHWIYETPKLIDEAAIRYELDTKSDNARSQSWVSFFYKKSVMPTMILIYNFRDTLLWQLLELILPQIGFQTITQLIILLTISN